MEFFLYGDKETAHLKKKDRKLAAAIDAIGPIQRPTNPDLFSALVSSIVAQQISTKAARTISGRMQDSLGVITPETVGACAPERLQSFGISFRKAAYIKNAAEKVLRGELDMDAVKAKPDEEVCRELAKLDGIGIWTAEMLMIFSMQRPDILSYGDLAIRRGLCMLHRHRDITRELFDKYRRRYSPYGSVASLYLWAIAGGALDGTELAVKKGGKKDD